MIVLIVNALLLSIGLTMDAFSISVANGLNEPHMKGSKIALIAALFAAFHVVMPMIGWGVVHNFAENFKIIYKIVPFIAFALLAYIGGKMILEAFPKAGEEEKSDSKQITIGVLLLQGVAISIDVLSVGFTIPEYSFFDAIVTSGIIGVVTFIVSVVGMAFGKIIGSKFLNKASIIGGCVLIAIGLKSLISGVLVLI